MEKRHCVSLLASKLWTVWEDKLDGTAMPVRSKPYFSFHSIFSGLSFICPEGFLAHWRPGERLMNGHIPPCLVQSVQHDSNQSCDISPFHMLTVTHFLSSLYVLFSLSLSRSRIVPSVSFHLSELIHCSFMTHTLSVAFCSARRSPRARSIPVTSVCTTKCSTANAFQDTLSGNVHHHLHI